MGEKIIIIGGVAGGATAAARLRRSSEEAEIILVERGEHISFANCGLPYYIGETIKDRSKLLVQTVKGMSARFKLDIRNLSEALRIDPVQKIVEIRNLTTGEIYQESYSKLLLSPGAKPIVPPIPGIDKGNLFTLRNIPDTDRIKKFVDDKSPKKAAVIGGGFIGIEMAENLADRGVEVTLIEMADQVMGPLDFEMASIIHGHLKKKGVKLVLKNGVKEFVDNGTRIILADGSAVSTDMTILAIGVAPENELAKTAGLLLGDRGGIVVNEYLQTSNEDIYAVGDAIETVDNIHGHKVMVPLAGPANRQGRIAADNMLGKRIKYSGVLGTSIAKVFDLTVAATGSNEKTMKRLGIPYEVLHIHPNSHAGYYPGAAAISMKLIFDKVSGKIYGAQAVGADGVDKRIDVIATAIKGGLAADELASLELAYAPPFSSAKDPVNIAGYVAANLMDGDLQHVQYHEIDQLIKDGGLLIDVRELAEREFGYIPGSVNIPLNEIRSRLDEIPAGRRIYVSCQVGLRGYLAARILNQHGFEAWNLDGGWKTYSSVYGNGSAHHQVEKDSGELVAALEAESKHTVTADLVVDVSGLTCPMPVMKLKEGIKSIDSGMVIELHASDSGALTDLPAWAERVGHTVVDTKQEGKLIKFWVKKK